VVPVDASGVEGGRARRWPDLANANARAARLSARVQQLETRLSRHLRNQTWHESGLGSPACTEELQQTITKLEQRTTDLTTALEEREAAREANGQLTRALNQRE
jgi:BMFP domain-containing protein YqiC